jgi:HPt (histidine-containing phosphotransfer) domain-containing protein
LLRNTSIDRVGQAKAAADTLPNGHTEFARLVNAGFDIKTALQRHLGKPALLNRIFVNFLSENSDAYDRIYQWLNNNNRDEILRFTHTLKSSAAAIGLQELSDVAKLCETACLKGEMPSRVQLQQLTDTMQKPMQALQAHVRSLQQSVNSNAPAPSQSVDIETLRPVINGTEQALKDDDASAFEWAERAIQCAGSNNVIRSELISIRAAIQDLEYPRALELLSALKREISL